MDGPCNLTPSRGMVFNSLMTYSITRYRIKQDDFPCLGPDFTGIGWSALVFSNFVLTNVTTAMVSINFVYVENGTLSGVFLIHKYIA